MTGQSLDYEFLRYIRTTSEEQKLHQRFYLSFFANCHKVLDLACGEGDFVELLGENGIEAIGIDLDSRFSVGARERGLNIICQDAFEYLEAAHAESVDGIFASHFVEHLDYKKVLELLQLSLRVLRRGGTIVLTTPNVRSLFSHLEMYHLHFGHVAFYHPRLLAFFLEHAGFADIETGENASPVSPTQPLFGKLSLHPIRTELPVWQRSWLHRVVRRVRMGIARVFAKPYLDMIEHNFKQIQNALETIDRPFECYAKAIKPSVDLDTAGVNDE